MAIKNKKIAQNATVQNSTQSSAPAKKVVDMNVFMASGRKIAAKHEAAFIELAK